MQKMACEMIPQARETINNLLSEGWRVVPGTIVLASMERSRQEYDTRVATPAGTLFDPYVAATLEKDDEGRRWKPTRERI